MTEYAVRARDLSKKFAVHSDRRNSLKDWILHGRKAGADEFWALKDATFDIPKGSTFGIIGHNGAGKSTALKVIAGIYVPTSGEVEVNGRLSALLELGAGFHPELTGRENIKLNASILGMSNAQIEGAMDEIIAFSELEKFIDTPIKVYSSGMTVRLGFAIAVKVDPEVLVIDEVIAVGDEGFQRKCFDYIAMLRQRGSTVLMVTHSLGVVEDMCDTAMWLDGGEVQELGPARDVVHSYLAAVNEAEAASERRPSAPVSEETAGLTRIGSGEMRVTNVEFRRADGSDSGFLVEGGRGSIRLSYEASVDMSPVTAGIGIFSENGVNVAGPNTGRSGFLDIPAGRGTLEFTMPSVILRPGHYSLTTVLLDGGKMIDGIERGFSFNVRGSRGSEPGLVYLEGDWLQQS